MPAGPVYIASDVHMGATAPEQERAFLDWLEHAAASAASILLNGDLFDFWFEYRGGRIPPGYDELLAALRRTVDSGTPVTLMGGNHDWWGGRYLREEVGLEFLQEPVVRTLAGHRTLVAHGDGLGAGDLGYRALKLLLRSRLTRFAFAQLGPGLGDILAGRVSRTDVRWGPITDADRQRAAALKAWAKDALDRRPELDLVLLGHTHIPAKVEVPGPASTGAGRWYLNSGDWVRHRSYLVLEEGTEPAVMTWTGGPSPAGPGSTGEARGG